LVVAPAGYGKSTLLADFAADCAEAGLGLAVCWYAPAPGQAAATLVLEGIARALRRQFPAVGERTLRLLAEARAGAAPDEAERLLTSAAAVLAGELQDAVAAYTLLVVDDYHLVDDDPAARRALELLLERLPAHVRVVLLSRSVPALDTSRLVLADQLAALGPRDLAFTPDELGLLLQERYGIAPEASLLDDLMRWTEGWVAGVVLAMGAATAPESAAGLAADLAEAWTGGERLHEYLASQLFRRLAAADQALLLAAAVPDVCDPAALDEALGRTDSGAALRRLERTGLPLERVAETGHYRLHALLQQFLRAHLERTDQRRHRRLRQFWGTAATARGDFAAAMTHFLAGRVYERAAQVLEQIGERWIDAGRRQLVETWLAQVPPSMFERRPRLVLCAARLCFAKGERALAVERAREAGFVARRVRDQVAAARALLLEAIATLGGRSSEESLRLCLQALELRTVRRHKALLAEAYRSLSIAETFRGLHEPAVEHMQRALELYEHAGQRWDVAVALNNLGVAYGQLGKPDQARWHHLRALTLRRELGDLAGVGRSLNNLGLLDFYRGAGGEAEAAFQEALALARQTANLRLEAAVHLNLGDLRAAQQRHDAALACYRAALAAAQACQEPHWHAFALVGEAGVHRAKGDALAAEAVARQALERAERGGLLEVAGHARAVLAAAALAAGRRREAASLLDAARQAVHETGSKALEARAYLWSGLAAYEQRRWGEALACVQVAAEAAAARGGPGLLALEGRALVPLLRMAAGRGVAPDLLARALDAIDAAAAAAVRDTAAPPAAPAALPALKLQLLGAFAASIDGRPVEAALPPRSRVRELLAYLAVHAGGRLRDEVLADLWPDARPGHDVTIIHTTTHRLRQVLFPEVMLGDAVRDGVYRLNPDAPLDVDVHRFERLVAAAERAKTGAQRRALLAKAVAAYGGPFFQECYADWAAEARRRLEQRYVAALAQLADAEWAAGEYRACVAACERLLEVEPAEEGVHCRVLECYERLGEPLAGLLHYRRYRRERAQVLAEPDAEGRGGRPPDLLGARMSAIVRRLERRLVLPGAAGDGEAEPGAAPERAG
jgi:ATP/maltotriose-dependent transcriptional regulator MalT/DNA-binding SARP family transcriptional activator